MECANWFDSGWVPCISLKVVIEWKKGRKTNGHAIRDHRISS